MATFSGVGGGAVGSCWGAGDQYFGRSAPAAQYLSAARLAPAVSAPASAVVTAFIELRGL